MRDARTTTLVHCPPPPDVTTRENDYCLKLLPPNYDVTYDSENSTNQNRDPLHSSDDEGLREHHQRTGQNALVSPGAMSRPYGMEREVIQYEPPGGSGGIDGCLSPQCVRMCDPRGSVTCCRRPHVPVINPASLIYGSKGDTLPPGSAEQHPQTVPQCDRCLHPTKPGDTGLHPPRAADMTPRPADMSLHSADTGLHATRPADMSLQSDVTYQTHNKIYS